MRSIQFALAISLLSFNVIGQSFQQAQKYIDMEQFGKAQTELKNVLKSKVSAENYFYVGNFFLTIEEDDSARYYFDKGIALDPKYALNFVGLGKYFLNFKNSIEATKNFDHALILSKSKNAEVYYQTALGYLAQENKNVLKIVDLLKKAIELNKSIPDYYIALGDAYLANNDGSNTAKSYDEAIRLDEKNTKARIRLGKVYVRAKAYNEALDLYKKALDLDPTYSPGYRELGELYLLAKQYDKAKENYKKYIELSDKNNVTLFRYAKFLFLSESYADALKVLTEVEPHYSSNPLIYRLFGYSYYETKDYPKAISNLETFFKNADTSRYLASDYEYYGKSLIDSGKDSIGILNLNKAIAKDSSKIELRTKIATVYYKNKKYLESAKEYELLFSKKPKVTANEYLSLGRAYYYGKEYVKGDTAFSKVIEKAPTSPAGYLFKARCKSQLDPESKTGNAAPFYEKYLELANADQANLAKNKNDIIGAYLNVAFYYWNIKKDENKAKELYNKVLELDSTNKQATAAIADLTKKK
jgi:tetratricopeptide (TPR) repeat protein